MFFARACIAGPTIPFFDDQKMQSLFFIKLLEVASQQVRRQAINEIGFNEVMIRLEDVTYACNSNFLRRLPS